MMSIIADIFKGGKTLSYPLVAFLAFAFSMATPSFAAEARSITGVERIVSAGAMSLSVTFEAGSPGDSHALYIAYDTEDKGETITDWAELQRGCNVAADATSATIPVSPLLTSKGYKVCRVFLTTSSAPYDTQLEYLRQSGTQYIDTGIKPDGTSVAVMDTKFDSNATRQQRFFGISSGDDATAVFSFDCYINGDGYFATACKNGKGDWKKAGTFTTDRVRISLSAAEKHQVIITNLETGGKIAEVTHKTTCSDTSIASLLVFALRTVKKSVASIPADKIAQGARLYSFTMSNSSGVLCDYKPCKLGDRVGVYDTVTGKIIYSASGTDFDAANSGSPVACSLLADETPLAAAPSATRLFFDYTWRGTAENWGDTDVWEKDGANATWTDGNNAIFTNANSAATLAADVSANSIVFRADATIAGTSDLSVKSVSVDSGVSATISAPISSAFEKTGSGTLTLGSSRTNQTTLTEGTLAMANGAMLDWTKFSFGTDPAKPVSLNLGGATLSADLTSCMSATVGGAAGGIVAIDNGVITNTAYLRVWNGSLTLGSDTQVTMDASSAERWVCVGGNNSGDESVTTMDACLILDGASINKSGSKNVLLGIGDFGSYPSKATMIVKNGGKSEIGDTAYVAQGCEGHLIIDGADSLLKAYDIKFCNTSRCEADENGYVVVTNGGTLAVRNLGYGSGKGKGYFRFDGGTLLATASVTLLPAHDSLHYIVGAEGGTIDNGGNNITIAKGLSGTGMIDLTGSGKTTFAAGVGVDAEGGVYVDTDTTLTISGTTTSCLGTLILKEGSTLDIATPVSDVAAFAATELLIPKKGDVTLTSGGGAFGEGLYAICKMSGVTPDAGANFAPSTGELAVSWSVVGDMLMLEVGDVKNTWTGAANDGDLSNHDNWYGKKVPTSGNCIIGNVSGADLTVGDIFAATSITFPAGSGPITISGERTLSGITAIVNNAQVHHVFNCPIVCADGVTPDITRGKDNYMTFAGGITMYDTPKTGGGVVDYWSGNVTLTTESPVTYATNGDKNYGFLVSGTTFTFNNGKIDRMDIDAGATAVVERLVYHNTVRNNKSGSKTAYYNEVFNNGSGTIRTKEVKNTGTAVLLHSYADSDMVGGTIIAEKLTCATTVQTGGGFPYPVFMLNCGTLSGTTVTTGAANGEGVWVIGPGGLAFGETIHDRSHFETKIGKSLGGRPAATLHSYADWTLQASPKGRDKTALNIGSANGGFIVIDTSHYAVGEAEYDSATSHTVTLDGQIVGGPMRVEGNGKVVFANEYNTFSGLTVTDTATASVKAGCKPGTGAVTLEAGTILEVAESGTATIDGVLTLADGAALAFNFTEKVAAPVLAVATPAALPATVNVKVSAADGVRPRGGQYTLTSGGAFASANVSLAADAPDWVKRVYVNEDGNIVLDVKARGTRVIVR